MTDSEPESASPAGDGKGAGPLQGIRVIELGTLIAGPFGGRLLADLGAEIIKVKRPGSPDPLRQPVSEDPG